MIDILYIAVYFAAILCVDYRCKKRIAAAEREIDALRGRATIYTSGLNVTIEYPGDNTEALRGAKELIRGEGVCGK